MSPSGWRVLILAATAAVLGAMQAAQDLLVPITYAILLAAILAPPIGWLRAKGLPQALAVVLVVIGALTAIVALIGLVGGSLQAFLADLPRYREVLDQRWSESMAWAQAQGLDVDQALSGAAIEPGAVLSGVGTLLSSMVGFASDALMIVLMSAFLLMEVDVMVPKIRTAFQDEEAAQAVLGTGEALQTYLGLKTITSAATGAVIWIGLALLGLDHAPLWGFVAFLLNYIPTIGSIVAAAPPLLLAIVTGGLLDAGIVMVLYLGVNTVVGNVLEPRIMGDQLGLSSFVVLLALLAWGWLWGVNGMLLSVPLTVLLRELFATWPDTQWIATLMSPKHQVLVGPDGEAGTASAP